jgi:hypothetical protein
MSSAADIKVHECNHFASRCETVEADSCIIAPSGADELFELNTSGSPLVPLRSSSASNVTIKRAA